MSVVVSLMFAISEIVDDLLTSFCATDDGDEFTFLHVLLFICHIERDR